MPEPGPEVVVPAVTDQAFHSFLAAKRALDDRSINEGVWQAFARSLRPGRADRPLRLFEVGAGIGGMIERLLERVSLGRADYLAVDSDPAHLPEAARRLQAWASRQSAAWSSSGDGRWLVETSESQMAVRWLTASLFDALVPAGPFDAILAHAFLDLVDLDRALPRLLGRLRPGGVFYFSLNFDGLTAFEPERDPALDRSIVDAYHATMDARRDGPHAAGDSRTGRRLLTGLPRHGGEVLAAGASDWVVFPHAGAYAAGEAVFLRSILDMVERSVGEAGTVPPERLTAWLARRRRQVDEGELVFIAHQLDVLGRVPPA